MTIAASSSARPNSSAAIARAARRIAPGIWEDRDGGLHFSVPELLAMVDLEDTPENRAHVEATVRESLERDAGATEIITVERKHSD